MRDKQENINLTHLRGIVSKERIWTYERMHEDMLVKAKPIVCKIDSIDNKNRNLNWLYQDKMREVRSLEIADVKEKYFAKRLLQSTIRNYKNRARRKSNNE